MSLIQLTEQAVPATPPTDKVIIFVDAADGLVKAKNDLGNVSVLGTAGLSLGLSAVFDNGSSALALGATQPFRVGAGCIIQGIELLSNTIGLVSIDVRRCVYNSLTSPIAASFTVVPTVKPGFNSVLKAAFNSLADGVITVTNGDWLQVVFNSVATIPKLTVDFHGVRS